MGFWPKSRRWRRLLKAGLGFLVLGLVALAVLRVPAVQARIVRWAVAGGEGWRLDVARVSVGLDGGEARGLDFSMPGIVARTEPGVAVRVRPGRFLFGGRELHVERAEADGVKIVLTPAEIEAGPGAQPVPFAGVLAAARSPLPWVLGAARIGAEVEVREAGEELARARMRIEGGGVSATSAGEFEYELEAASRFLPPGPDAVARSRGAVRVRQNASHGVAAVTVRGELELPVYGAVRLPPGRFTLEVEETPTGERYAGTLGLVEAEGGAEATGSFAASYDRAAGVFSGTIEARVDARVLAWAGLAGTDSGAMWPTEGARLSGSFEVDTDGRVRAARFALGPEAGGEWLAAETADGAAWRVVLREFPLGWLAARLGVAGLRAEGAAASGEWRVAAGVGSLKVNTVRALEIGPVAWDDGLAPALPAARVSVDALAEVAREGVRWELRSLRAGTADGKGPEARLRAQGWWRFPEGDGSVEEAAGELFAAAGDAEPVARWALADALEIDAGGAPRWKAGGEVAVFSVRGLPLGWLSRWSPEAQVSGVWRDGAGVVRVTEDGDGFELAALRPWRFEALRVADAAGAVLFAGEVALSPKVRRGGDGQWTGEVNALSVKEAGGRALAGRVAGSWAESDGAYAGEVALRAELPGGDVAPAEFGALAVELRAKLRSVAERVGRVEAVSVAVSGAGGELAALRGEEAWLYARRPNGEVVFNSLAAWRVTTAARRLESLRAFFPEGLEAEGAVGATEFLLMAEPGLWRLRPLRQLVIGGLTARRDGAEVARAVDVAFYPGLDLQVAHTLEPSFQLAWTASAHATGGRVDTAGGRALEFEAAAGAVGDLEQALPSSVDVAARGELAAVRAGFPDAAAGLPKAGRFTFRIDGALSGAEPLEAWARVEDVPAAEGGRMLEPLELSARGKVDGVARSVAFDVALRMGEGEGGRAGDLAFGATLALEDGTLRLDSALRGKRWDVAESLAWMAAMGDGAGATAAEKEGVRAVQGVGEASEGTLAAGVEGAEGGRSIGSAFWSALRGRFELDIGELRMAPYRVERLRGRVRAEERELVVDELGGEMFAGRLGGGFTMRYEPGEAGGDHALSGALRIEQFDTARVVQAVFPNEYGSLDATVDMRAAVRGRGFRLPDLLERAEVEFAVKGRGVARLTHPDAGTASTLLVMGGVLTLSPELRALGRLLRKFAEMPLDELSIEGGRGADGAVRLARVRMESPQVRLEGAGVIAAAEGVPLPARDLSFVLGLGARDEAGVILGRMRLLEKKADAEGFRRLNQAVAVKGLAGRPDASELYELFARGVAGSRGTWGLIMRKVQREVEKQQALAGSAAAKEAAR